jgi:sterol desaturase/sphingolipid hydroxylase (fatty acid hydroxylase superfamily)
MRDGTEVDRGWRKTLSLSIVPLAVLLGLGVSVWMMRAGVEPAKVVGPISIAAFLLVAVMERVLPWHRDWNHSRGDLRSDALYVPTQFGVGALFRPLVASLAVAGGGWLSQQVQGGIWPHSWPVAAQVVLATVVREFFDYWGHRAMHRFDWLWRLHATHHSATRLYFLNGARAHPGEIAFRFGILGVLPLATLGVGEEVLALTTVAALTADAFQHANIAFRLGPLSWLYSIGDAHRWHHSRKRGEADSNYGNVYLFWDAIFGTRYLPSDREPPAEVGIEGLDAFPRGFFAQWLSPFRWGVIEQESRSQRPAEG